MKSNKKITAKTVSLTLCAAMACSCIGMLAYAAGEKSGESQLTAAVTQTVDTQRHPIPARPPPRTRPCM